MPNGITKETFEGFDTNSKLDTMFDYMLFLCRDFKDIKKDLGKLPCQAENTRMNGMQRQINWLMTLVLGIPTVVGVCAGIVFYLYRMWPFA